MSICNRCARRKCKSKPKRRLEREFCYKYVEPKAGFPLFEIAIENTPIEVLTLLNRYGLDFRNYIPKEEE